MGGSVANCVWTMWALAFMPPRPSGLPESQRFPLRSSSVQAWSSTMKPTWVFRSGASPWEGFSQMDSTSVHRSCQECVRMPSLSTVRCRGRRHAIHACTTTTDATMTPRGARRLYTRPMGVLVWTTPRVTRRSPDQTTAIPVHVTAHGLVRIRICSGSWTFSGAKYCVSTIVISREQNPTTFPHHRPSSRRGCRVAHHYPYRLQGNS